MPIVALPDIPTVAIVAELLTVNAFTVELPLTDSVVNIAVLGVALPIGVFCKPPVSVNEVIDNVPVAVMLPAVMLPAVMFPVTPNVPPTVAELLTVNAFTVELPVVFRVAPLKVAPELPIVAALMVVPVRVPLNDRPVSVPTDVILV